MAGLAAASLGLAACGGGGDTTDSASGGDATDEAAGGAFELTLTADAIDAPAEVEGGVVEVSVTTELEGGEVSFTQVPEGTTEDAFKEALAPVLGGGPFPELLGDTAGVSARKGTTTHSIELPTGNYYIWAAPDGEEEEPGDSGGEGGGGGDTTSTSEAAAGEIARGQATSTTSRGGEGGGGEGGGGEGQGGPPPEALVVSALTVTDGEGELPETDGTITAKDYTFEVDVEAGDTFTFRNEGPTQFHHVVLFSFGDLDEDVVTENFPKFLESGDDAPPPPAFKDVDFEKLEAGGSGVFSPGLGGTFSAKLEAGTYVAACFIGDKTGGPPHAIAKKMWKVFTVS